MQIAATNAFCECLAGLGAIKRMHRGLICDGFHHRLRVQLKEQVGECSCYASRRC